MLSSVANKCGRRLIDGPYVRSAELGGLSMGSSGSGRISDYPGTSRGGGQGGGGLGGGGGQPEDRLLGLSAPASRTSSTQNILQPTAHFLPKERSCTSANVSGW